MRLIVGLGNPGEKYKNNRHNVGFMFVDHIAEQIYNSKSKIKNLNLEFKMNKHLNSELLTLNSELTLAKPQTFMNKSGQAVKKLIENCKLKIENLIVVHDDLDIPLGKFKIHPRSGPELHNGLKSIENHLMSKDFWRVRIGVDNRPAGRSLGEGWIDGETYVLNDFAKEEKEILVKTVFLTISNQLKSSLLHHL